jgi:hypothetical protein
MGGMTLAQCAECYGITRERVRQVFKRWGLPGRTAEQRRALRRLDAATSERVAQLYRRTGDVAAVARELGVSQPAVREALPGVLPQHSIFRPVQKMKPRYSDEELLGILREVSSHVGGVITVHDYTTFAAGRVTADGRPWPTHQTPQKRFGSWREALLRAGLGANPSTPIRGKRLFEPEHCIDAIRGLACELGRVPTARDYELFAARSGGSAPSLSIVRLRCGSWHLALVAALKDYGWAMGADKPEAM